MYPQSIPCIQSLVVACTILVLEILVLKMYSGSEFSNISKPRFWLKWAISGPLKSKLRLQFIFFTTPALVHSTVNEKREPGIIYTVEPVLKDHAIGHKNVDCQDRWSLVTGLEILKCRSFCRKCVVCQDRWSLMAVVSQDSFHCIYTVKAILYTMYCVFWLNAPAHCTML